MAATPTSKLQAWQNKLFGTTTNAQGEEVYVNEDVQKIWDTFKNKQVLNKQTPRIPTAPQSLDNFKQAGELEIDLTRGYNKALIDHAYDDEPLKNLRAEREVRTRGGHLVNQTDNYIRMRQPVLDLQGQMVHNRSNVDLPALIASVDRQTEAQSALNDQIARDQLVGRLLQGAGMLGVFLS
jgi:hypothetical protein